MEFQSDNQKVKIIEWTDTLEDYFAKIGEKAQGYSLLHKQAEALYSYRTTLIDLPVIILSTVCGTLSIGGANIFPAEWFETANQVVGTLSIGVGVLNTIGTYFAWSKRAEAHRVSSLQYARMSRFLRVELSLPREERMNCAELLKMVRTDWERLTEISPILPENLINIFREMYKKRTVSKPDEIHGIEPIRIFNTQPKQSFKDILATNLNAIRMIGKEQDTLNTMIGVTPNIQHKMVEHADYAKSAVKGRLFKSGSFRRANKSDTSNYRQAIVTDSDSENDVNQTIGVVDNIDLELGQKRVSFIGDAPTSPRPIAPQQDINE